MLDAFERSNRSVVGLAPVPASEIGRFGCAAGVWEEPGGMLGVTEVIEKPDVETARERLTVDGLPEDTYLAFFGLYVLKPRIFDYLGEDIARNIRERGEFQLTPAIERLRREDGLAGPVVRGRAFDIGNPEAYLRALREYSGGGTDG